MKIIKAVMTVVAAAVVVVGGYFALKAAYQFYFTHAYPTPYQDIVEEQSKATGVPTELIYAVIRSESGFDPTAESSVGARGLMQITEETLQWAAYRKNTADQVSYDALFDPQVNITYGTYILSLLLDEFKEVDTALCAYHAGWGNVKQWLSQEEYSENGSSVHNIPFGDTKKYVKKVLETMDLYQRLYQM